MSQSNRGQTFALIIGVFALACSAFCAYSGHETTACVIGGSTLVGLVVAFIKGKSNQSEELEESKPVKRNK